ncbi:MAG: RDD family protein [Bdellovibrionales bacterium]|nr:RDD family protein [Bdellovibrionales bacterium]
MKCPVCSFISSDKRDICPKCSVDLRPHKEALGITVSHPNVPADELRKRYREAGRRKGKGRTSPPKRKVKQSKQSSGWLQLLGIGEKKKAKRQVKKKQRPVETTKAAVAQKTVAQKTVAPVTPAVLKEEKVQELERELETVVVAPVPQEPITPTADIDSLGAELESYDETAEVGETPEPVAENELEADELTPPPAVEEPSLEVSIRPSEILSNIPQVAPEVLDLGDTNDDEFERLLDDMIGDVSFDVEAVAVEKPKKEMSEVDVDLSGLIDEDIEVSFEFGHDDDDDDEEYDDECEFDIAAGDEELEQGSADTATELPESVLSHLLEDLDEEASAPSTEVPLQHLLDEDVPLPTITPDEVTDEMIAALELEASNEEDLKVEDDAVDVGEAEQLGDTDELDAEIAAYINSIEDVDALQVLDSDEEEQAVDDIENYVASVESDEVLEVLEANEEELEEVIVEAAQEPAPDVDVEIEVPEEPLNEAAPEPEVKAKVVEEEETEEVIVEAAPDPEAETETETNIEEQEDLPALAPLPASIEEFITAVGNQISSDELLSQLISALATRSDVSEDLIRNALSPAEEETEFEDDAPGQYPKLNGKANGLSVHSYSEALHSLPPIAAEIWSTASEELHACYLNSCDDFEMDAGELVAFQPTNSATILFDLAGQELSGKISTARYSEALPNSAAAILQSEELEDEVARLEQLLSASTAESLEEAVIAVGNAIGSPGAMGSALVPEVMFIVSDENAKLWKRAAAKFIDISAAAVLGLIITAIFFIPQNPLSALFSFDDWMSGVNAPYGVLAAMFAALVLIVSSTSLITDHGKTLGKAIMGLRVASATDFDISLSQSFARACLEAASIFLAGLPLLTDIHNKLAKTKIVAEFKQGSDR